MSKLEQFIFLGMASLIKTATVLSSSGCCLLACDVEGENSGEREESPWPSDPRISHPGECKPAFLDGEPLA